ncbi:MAG: DNA primase [Bacteroidota bacterium]
MIDPATIEEIKNRMDITEVVGDFVNLKRSGSSLKALSPFTTEKTPSFYVVPSKGIFKDFSSGKGGDAITFVMEIDGLSYVEALKYLAGKYGIEIKEEEQSDEVQAAQNRRESLYIAMNYANELFKRQLAEHEEGQSIGYSYFRERGFSDETIKAFGLGYALEGWDHLYKEATKAGYSKEVLEEAGLITTRDDRTYDRFRGRVTFPIHNITGKVIAFGARTLSKEKKGPKYLNSPETELYNKSKVLYGLFQAKQSIRQEDNCFLVEGYTDVISLHQAGVPNVVSSSGTALTEDQVKLIKRYSKNVTVLFDGDAAGIRASIRGIDMLLEGDLNVKAVPLPDGEDPDSYSRQLGTAAFQHYLQEEAQDIIRFKAGLLLQDIERDPIKRSEAIREMVSSIAKIGDPVKRAVYIKECSDLMDIPESVLILEQNKLLIERGRKAAREELPPEAPPLPTEPPTEAPAQDLTTPKTAIYYQERESIRVLINYGNEQILNQEEENQYLIDYFLSEIDEIEFTHPIYHRILRLIREHTEAGNVVNMQYLLQHGDEDIKKEVVELSASKYEVSEFWRSKHQIVVPKETENLKNLTLTNILRLKFRIIQHLIEEQRDRLKAHEGADIDQILDDINELKKTEMEIAAYLGNVVAK